MRLYMSLCLLWLWAAPVFAAPLSLQNLYINPKGKRLPEAIIFYNSANPCENCHKAVNMLINVLWKNYRGLLHAYLINEAKHPEFTAAFKLKGPLTLVIIRISDGASFGYQKLTGLQSETESPAEFNRHITNFINNFLGFN